MLKFAILTPPLLYNCGRNIRGFLKCEPSAESFFAELEKQFFAAVPEVSQYHQEETKEEKTYAYIAFIIAKKQIDYIQSAYQKYIKKYIFNRNTHCENKKFCIGNQKHIILPGFFSYLFDDGIQTIPYLLTIFNEISKVLFNEYFR